MKNHQLAIIFNITFAIGYLFRLFTFGWLMIMLLLPEYFFRSLYYIYGMKLLKKQLTKSRIILLNLLQIFYLLTSFFSYDSDDKNSYTFAHLWLNPPEKFIFYSWISLVAVTLILLIVNIAQVNHDQSYNFKDTWYMNPVMGIIFIPAVMIGLCMGVAFIFS